MWRRLRGHPVAVRRGLLGKLLRGLLWAVLRLLVSLRSIVRMIVLSRQRRCLRRLLHWAVLRAILRWTVWRTMLRVRLILPLRTWVSGLWTRALGSWNLRTYIRAGILGVIPSWRALVRALWWAIIDGGMWVRSRRVKIPPATLTAASTSATATAPWRALVLRLLHISVLRIL